MRSMRKLVAALVAAAMLMSAAPRAEARGKGFKDIVRHIEKTYGVKKTRIPMLGLANFAIKLIRPAGVKGFKLAVFEDFDFMARTESQPFTEVMRTAYNRDWQPLVQINSRRDGARTFIYSRQSGKKDMEFAIVTFDQREAVVLEAKLNPEAAARFLENPRVMGVSLGNSIRGNDARVARAKPDASPQAPSPRTGAEHAAAPESVSPASVLNVSGDEGVAGRPALEGEPVATAGSAGAVAATPAEKAEKDAIRIETRLVNLNVKAMDRKGQPLVDLNPQDFVVLEDGVRQDISHFKPVNAPLNVVLLLDLSGSTRNRRKPMAEAARKFIDALPPQDRVSIVAFTRNYKPLTEFTADKARLRKSLDRIEKIAGGTRYYDSMWMALDQLEAVPESRKAIVVMTDGEDESLIGNASTTHTFEDLLDRASEEDVTIYPIYFRPQQDLSRLGVLFGGGGLLGNEKGKAARGQLQQVAEQTGGEVINAQREEDLDEAYRRVAAELHTLYSLAYSPDNPRHNGQFRKISVDIRREGAVARTRRGYFDK